MICLRVSFFFNVTATTEIYTLSLHDALPIFAKSDLAAARVVERLTARLRPLNPRAAIAAAVDGRSEEHTSELQSHSDLVCRLLLEKKKKNRIEEAFRTRTSRRDNDANHDQHL